MNVAVKHRTNPVEVLLGEPWLLFAVLSILGFGLVMVASSSIVISDREFNFPFHFLTRQSIYLCFALIVSVFVLMIPMDWWKKVSPLLFIISVVLLAAVLIPGIGHVINGSRRWIGVGPITVQVSEIAKFSFFIFLANYLERRQEEVQEDIKGFMKPMALLGLCSLLLLLEPDFGATVVMVATAMAILFLGGVKVRHFLMLGFVVLLALSLLAVMSPYRLARITTFLHPWAVQFDSGYQLTQSLIAFGRGGWFGVGLGFGSL